MGPVQGLVSNFLFLKSVSFFLKKWSPQTVRASEPMAMYPSLPLGNSYIHQSLGTTTLNTV